MEAWRRRQRCTPDGHLIFIIAREIPAVTTHCNIPTYYILMLCICCSQLRVRPSESGWDTHEHNLQQLWEHHHPHWAAEHTTDNGELEFLPIHRLTSAHGLSLRPAMRAHCWKKKKAARIWAQFKILVDNDDAIRLQESWLSEGGRTKNFFSHRAILRLFLPTSVVVPHVVHYCLQNIMRMMSVC